MNYDSNCVHTYGSPVFCVTLEKKIILLLLPWHKPFTFQLQVQHSNRWAIPVGFFDKMHLHFVLAVQIHLHVNSYIVYLHFHSLVTAFSQCQPWLRSSSSLGPTHSWMNFTGDSDASRTHLHELVVQIRSMRNIHETVREEWIGCFPWKTCDVYQGICFEITARFQRKNTIWEPSACKFVWLDPNWSILVHYVCEGLE